MSGRRPVISDARDGEHTATRHGSCLVGVPSSAMHMMGNTRRPDSRLVSGRRPVISDARDGPNTRRPDMVRVWSVSRHQ